KRCRYDEGVSGRTIYAYVGGNPLSGVDPNGLLNVGDIGKYTPVMIPVATAIGEGVALVTMPAWVIPAAIGTAVVGGGIGLYYYLRADGGSTPVGAADVAPAAPSSAYPQWTPIDGENWPDRFEQREAEECHRDDDCAKIGWSIDVIVRTIKMRGQQISQNGGENLGGHPAKIKVLRRILGNLVLAAKAKHCPYNPDANSLAIY
ncbi:MAG: hypothetical protein ABI605_13130, partial [Rhizobacter sp.]